VQALQPKCMLTDIAATHNATHNFSCQFLEDLPKRLTGPGRLRFTFQPAVAVCFGIRAGISDARSRREPFVFGVLFDTQRLRALLKEAFEQGSPCRSRCRSCRMRYPNF
jgi:hypothetical protein